MDKKKIELTYLDGDNMTSYNIQLNNDEYEVFNKMMIRYHGRVDVVGKALSKLTENEVCTRHHKNKLNEILSKTLVINFRLLEG